MMTLHISGCSTRPEGNISYTPVQHDTKLQDGNSHKLRGGLGSRGHVVEGVIVMSFEVRVLLLVSRGKGGRGWAASDDPGGSVGLVRVVGRAVEGVLGAGSVDAQGVSELVVVRVGVGDLVLVRGWESAKIRGTRGTVQTLRFGSAF